MAVVLSLIILGQYLGAILTSFVLAYLFHPVYTKLKRLLRFESLTAIVVIALAFIIVLVPLLFSVNLLTKEVFVAYLMIKQQISSPGFTELLRALNIDASLQAYVQHALQNAAAFFVDQSSTFALSLTKRLADFAIAVILTYYLLKDGPKLLRKLEDLLEIESDVKEDIVKGMQGTVHAVIYGTLIVALIQGALAALGYFIFGVQSPMLWGVVTAFLALIPLVGPAIVWLLLAIIMIANGASVPDIALMWKGIGLVIYGIFVISGIDNILKPKLIADRAKLHPALALLGVVGGLRVFGIVGIIVGPVIIALLLTLVNIYHQKRILILG